MKTSASLTIKYVDESTALVTKAFAKRANLYGTPEFNLWREYKAQFPKAKMHTKTIKRKPDKKVDTRNMTYKNMADYIRTQENSAKLMIDFELTCKRSKVQTNPYRHVLAWFIQTFEGYDSYKAFFERLANDKAKEDNIFRLEKYVTDNAVNE